MGVVIVKALVSRTGTVTLASGRYSCLRLRAFRGQHVLVRVDNKTPHRAHIYTQQFVPVGQAARTSLL